MLELGMRALAMQRWLWGLLMMGLLALPTPAVAKAGPGAPPVAPQIHIPPFGAPASMPALGEELARGLYAALREANIPARLGRGDEGSALSGRLDEISHTQVRLQASYHGHSAQSVGDLEHLDDLVYAVFAQLRPRLQLADASDSRAGALDPPSTAGAAPPAGPGVPTTAATVALVGAPPRRPATSPGTHTSPGTRRQSAVGPKPAAPSPVALALATPSKEPPAGSPPELPETLPAPPLQPPTSSETPAPAPVKKAAPLAPRPALAPFTFDPRRPRVAVHVVGDPLSRIPSGYYGLGAIGQQGLISYLQQRLRVPAVASRLVGLTGGLTALDEAMRLGARHTLMVRVDSLVLGASPTSGPGAAGPLSYPGGTLAGRLHLVLLFDGKLLFDRSIMMPPTLILPQESPAQAYSRLLYATMDSVAGELTRVLQSSPQVPLSPPASPG